MNDEQLEQFEARKYENIIAKYDDRQLVLEQAILNEEENLLYIRKKAIKEELKRRLRGN